MNSVGGRDLSLSSNLLRDADIGKICNPTWFSQVAPLTASPRFDAALNVDFAAHSFDALQRLRHLSDKVHHEKVAEITISVCQLASLTVTRFCHHGNFNEFGALPALPCKLSVAKITMFVFQPAPIMTKRVLATE